MNPVLPVMQELVQRGEQVLCLNNEEFRPQIEATGAHFRAYPPSILTATAISQAKSKDQQAQPEVAGLMGYNSSLIAMARIFGRTVSEPAGEAARNTARLLAPSLSMPLKRPAELRVTASVSG